MDPITLPSGRELVLGVPDLAVAKHLFKTVARELKTVDLDIKLETFSAKSLGDLDINVFKNAILQLAASDAIESAWMACATKTLIGNGDDKVKVTKDAFEHETARQDYLLVAWEVMRFTLVPFLRGLASVLPTSAPQTAGAPK